MMMLDCLSLQHVMECARGRGCVSDVKEATHLFLSLGEERVNVVGSDHSLLVLLRGPFLRLNGVLVGRWLTETRAT